MALRPLPCKRWGLTQCGPLSPWSPLTPMGQKKQGFSEPTCPLTEAVSTLPCHSFPQAVQGQTASDGDGRVGTSYRATASCCLHLLFNPSLPHLTPTPFLFFKGRIFHSSGWPQTWSVTENDLELILLPPLPSMARIISFGATLAFGQTLYQLGHIFSPFKCF